MDTSKSEIAGYILRIATEQWVDHVFEMAIYYTNMKRKWKSGQAILFIHKTKTGDALVGYGVVDHMAESNALFEEDRLECERGSWKKARVQVCQAVSETVASQADVLEGLKTSWKIRSRSRTQRKTAGAHSRSG